MHNSALQMIRNVYRWHTKAKEVEAVMFELRSLEMLKAQVSLVVVVVVVVVVVFVEV